jgi:hypothetical protein
MASEEKWLIPLQLNNELVVRNPQSVVNSIVEFNQRTSEFFKTEAFLKEINEKFFSGKGTLVKYPSYDVTVKEADEKGEKSRFNRFFSVNADLSYTSLATTLLIKKSDLPLSKDESFDSLGLTVSNDVNTKDNLFEIQTYGEITFVKIRYVDRGLNYGSDCKSFYLRGMGESRFLSFPLVDPPAAEKVFQVMALGVKEILDGFAAQGYITMPEVVNPVTDTPDAPEVPETRNETQ